MNERLSENVLFYSMDKLYYVSDTKHNSMIDSIPVCIEENIKMEDYFEHYNNKTVTISMDSRLSEYLYNGDCNGAKEVQEKVSKIFENHGFYYDFGSNWYIYAKPSKH